MSGAGACAYSPDYANLVFCRVYPAAHHQMEHNGVGQAMKRCPIQPARVHGRKPAQPEKEHPGEGPCSIRRHKMLDELCLHVKPPFC